VNKIVKDNNLVPVSDKQDDEDKLVGVIKHMVKMQTDMSEFSCGK
jgi:hypothetical protein